MNQEKLLEQVKRSNKVVKQTMKEIDEHYRRFDEKMKKILEAL